MNVVIIEDEPQAVQRLEKVILELEPSWKVLDKIDSVKGAVRWLRQNIHVDLIFLDIQLADGLSFEIFEQTTVHAPVIFTTAYNEYALKAFKVNSIDYILKPVDKDELLTAIEKFKKVTKPVLQQTMLESIAQTMKALTRTYKERFMIKTGEHLRSVETSSILYFFSQEKASFCHTNEGRSFILDFTLEQLEEMVDPLRYFRVNRQYLVSAAAIQDIISYTNSRLKLVLRDSTNKDIIVARERVQEFKDWLDR